MHKTKRAYLLLLFLISPFIGLITLFKIKSEKFYLFFGTLFFGLVGSLFIYVEGRDGYSHLQNVQMNYLNMSFAEFIERSYEIITLNATAGSTDLYLHILSFLSGSILQTPAFIHVFAGLVLGYFFTQSVLLLLRNHLFDKKEYILLGFIFLFLLIRSISALNSIRMWTGMWVLFYGTYSWILTKERKYIYVILFSVFVHFSYLVILIPVIISYLLRKRKIVMISIFALSFFASIGIFNFSSFIPQSELLESKQKSYVIDSEEDAERFEDRRELAEEARGQLNFYKAFGETNYVNYSIVGLAILLLFFYKKKKIDPNLTFLIATGIGLYAFANFASFSPSLMGRTKMIASTFILAAAIYLQLNINDYQLKTKTKRFLNGGLLIFLISALPMVLFQISYIIQNTSLFLFLFPQISWVLGPDDFSIREALGVFID